MKLAFVLTALCLVMVGCGSGSKKDQEAGTNQPPAASSTSGGNPITAPVDYLGAVSKAQKSAVKTLDMAGLQQSIQMFQASEERYPKDLNELVTKGYMKAVPTAPAGYKFSYNPATGEVKLTQ